jgi:hypothetical protein
MYSSHLNQILLSPEFCLNTDLLIKISEKCKNPEKKGGTNASLHPHIKVDLPKS